MDGIKINKSTYGGKCVSQYSWEIVLCIDNDSVSVLSSAYVPLFLFTLTCFVSSVRSACRANHLLPSLDSAHSTGEESFLWNSSCCSFLENHFNSISVLVQTLSVFHVGDHCIEIVCCTPENQNLSPLGYRQFHTHTTYRGDGVVNTRILEVTCWNFDPETGYPGWILSWFSQSVQANTDLYLKFGHVRFSNALCVH
jgi:hypothetical protein